MAKKNRLVAGVAAPALEGTDLRGQPFSLPDLLQERAAVVIFLRGFG